MLKNKYVAASLAAVIVIAVIAAGMMLDQPSGETGKLKLFDPKRQTEFPEVDGKIKEVKPVGAEEITAGTVQAAAELVRKAQKFGVPLILLLTLAGLGGWIYGYANQRPLNRGTITVGIGLLSLLFINYPATTTWLLFSMLETFFELFEKL